MCLSNLANHIEKRQAYLRRREEIKAAVVAYANEVGIPQEKRAEFFTALTADVDAQKSAF
ncbi:hypothetical protein FACS1894170_08980 [Planctomycetales bacterium]|nr:hypothetical protein FACS1894170_08980 [Planctomycetales bacterium]